MNAFDTTRRDFLKTSGTAFAGAAVLPGFLDGVVRKAGFDAELAAAPTTLVTACAMCASVCGVKATVSNGVLTFVEGLPGDLDGDGKLCAKGKSAPGFLYDPDRLKYPMKRTNPVKGIGVDPGWVKISWDEALDLAGEAQGDDREERARQRPRPRPSLARHLGPLRQRHRHAEPERPRRRLLPGRQDRLSAR
jgi:anaerobic selenocysteine-containing dehydrogenase